MQKAAAFISSTITRAFGGGKPSDSDPNDLLTGSGDWGDESDVPPEIGTEVPPEASISNEEAESITADEEPGLEVATTPESTDLAAEPDAVRYAEDYLQENEKQSKLLYELTSTGATSIDRQFAVKHFYNNYLPYHGYIIDAGYVVKRVLDAVAEHGLSGGVCEIAAGKGSMPIYAFAEAHRRGVKPVAWVTSDIGAEPYWESYEKMMSVDYFTGLRDHLADVPCFRLPVQMDALASVNTIADPPNTLLLGCGLPDQGPSVENMAQSFEQFHERGGELIALVSNGSMVQHPKLREVCVRLWREVPNKHEYVSRLTALGHRDWDVRLYQASR